MMTNVESGQSVEQLTRLRPDRAGLASDLAQDGDGEHAAEPRAIEQLGVEAGSREQVTGDEVDRRAGGESQIEIVQLESTAPFEPEPTGGTASHGDGDVGAVDRKYVESALRQPQRTAADPARNVECRSFPGEEVDHVDESGWDDDVGLGPLVPSVPPGPVGVTHG